MSDIWGPAGKESIGKWKYYISFTDDCTRYVHVLFLKDKGQAFDHIIERVAQIKRHCRKVLKWLCFDNGKELVNEKLRKLAAVLLKPQHHIPHHKMELQKGLTGHYWN